MCDGDSEPAPCTLNNTDTLYPAVTRIPYPKVGTTNSAVRIGVGVVDTAEITSNVLAAAVAVSASSGSVSGSLALAVSLAQNTLDGASLASIDGSTVTSTSGDVSVSALADNRIDAIAAAAGISVAASTSVGVSIAGAGAWAKNVMTNEVEASIVDSTVAADGALDVLAVDSSSITALLVSVSTSVAVGSTGAVGVGLSLALAENEIAGTTVATIEDSTAIVGGDVSVLANDGGILALTLDPWSSGNNALVVDGARRYADLKESGQVVDLKDAAPWSSGTNSLGGVTLDGDVAVDTTTDAIALGTTVDLTAADWSTGNHSLTTNKGAKVVLITGGTEPTVAGLNAGNDTLTFTEAHGFAEGDIATYDSDDASATSDLVSGTKYRVVVVDAFTIKLQSGHTFADGDLVTYSSDLGSDTSGLFDGAKYTVQVVDEFNIKLKPQVPIWASGTNSLDISGGGSVTLDAGVDLDPNADTITFGSVVDLSAEDWSGSASSLTPRTGVALALDGTVSLNAGTDELTFGSEHGFADGDIVTYESDLDPDTSGLVSGNEYRVVVVDEFTIQLQTGHAFADGDVVTYSSDLPGDASGLVDGATYEVELVDAFSIKLKDYQALDGTESVDIIDNTIQFASAHRFQDGDILEYRSDLGGSDDSGLADGGRYRVTVIDADTIQLSDSRIIDSLAISAAVAVAVSGSVSVGVAAAGAVAHNTIEGGFEASVVRSDVDAAGDVDVVAQDSSAIRSMLFSAAVSVSASGSAAVGVAMSVAEAENLIDGDTLVCNYRKVRLANVYAAELNQTGGAAARDRLKARIASGRVTLKPIGADRYGRVLAEVYVDGRRIEQADVGPRKGNGSKWGAGRRAP